MASDVGRLGLRESPHGRDQPRARPALRERHGQGEQCQPGGDPAEARVILRIYARDMQGQVRQLSYKEGSKIDASQFYNYGGGGGNPGKPGYPGPGFPGGGGGDLQIVRAYYGLNNRTNDVTQLLRGRVQNGTSSFRSITTTWAAILRSAATRC